jgi:prevent-host-death family protein
MAEADPQKTFNMHQAKSQLSRLVERAEAGEEIIIARDGRPRARLVSLAPERRPKRKPGRFKHLLKDVTYDDIMSPCFTEEELDEIENASIFPPEH